ncbi:hypothetical protein [Streptomyces sp. NPDC020965]|uniref:hypothetical protein n=1 Tax=Streptomyces sp. NPDC020965 TaxID=3365105 RepID=UPI0037A572F0
MPARRRIALTLASAALLVPLATGCSDLDKAIDCVETAETLVKNVENLTEAFTAAGEDPTKSGEALDAIDKALKDLDDKTDNADLRKAVDELKDGIDSVRKDVEGGDSTPRLNPLTSATDEIRKVCSP